MVASFFDFGRFRKIGREKFATFDFRRRREIGEFAIVIITRTNGGYRIGFGYALTRMRIIEYANAVNSRANIVVGK